VTIFQPHRYSRTKLLLEQFGNCFQDSDIVVINDIYPANEKPIPGISSELVYQKVKNYKKDSVFYLSDKEITVSFLKDFISNGDIVVTMGAGDVWKIGKQLAKELRNNKIKVGIGS
jgi:UDP-N-acetylmuramate--alanine ligase